MRILALLTAVVLATTLADCAGPSSFERKLASWVGDDEQRLVESWGVPTRRYVMPDGGAAIEYVYDRGSVARFNAFTRTARAFSRTCTITFYLTPKGVIRAWRWQGKC